MSRDDASAPAIPGVERSPKSPRVGSPTSDTTSRANSTSPAPAAVIQADEGLGADEDEFVAVAVNGDAASFWSDTTSLQSRAMLHAWENGRRYHRYRHARYPIPNDETEQAREDMLHAMMLEVTDGKLFFAPIEHLAKVIDLGTGTGIWAVDVGDQCPGAEVLGVDMSPTQSRWVPPNVHFVNDDLREAWHDGDNWDLVHLRHMVPILEDPVALLRKAYDHIRPGGWLELQDVDGQVHCDDGTLPQRWPLTRFTELMVEAFATYDGNAHAAVFGRQYLEQAGFINIQHHTRKLPYGTWARDKTMRLVGMYYRAACEEFFPVVGAMHLPRLGWSENEMQALFAQCRAAMRDPKVHAYGLMHFWSGQRPVTDVTQ